MSLRPALLLTLLLAPLARGAPSDIVAATAEDQAGFQETADRFKERMKDFSVEARLIADGWEAQQRKSLADSYAEDLNALGQESANLRDATVDKFESFLKKYPNTRYTPHVMFRLGELYFEVAEEQYFTNQEEYDRLGSSAQTEEDFIALASMQQPEMDYGPSIRLYREIVQKYTDYQYIDGAYYMLGYCLSKDVAKQYNAAEGRDMYAALVDKFPDSSFAADANMRLGEYYFDENKLEDAIVYYQRVVDQGKEGRNYDKGLYKLAWSYYRKAKEKPEYVAALRKLAGLLDWSEENFAQTGKDSSTAPEAIEYMAISFSDIADKSGLSPVGEAQEFFTAYGERAYEDKIYKRLADVLTQQARYEQAIATYEYIQKRWPNDPDNPVYQFTIASLYNSLPVPDPLAAQDAVRVLTERYDETSSWYASNRANPDALAIADKYIEDSLATVATNYHILADQTGNREDYDKAATTYREYLTRFPFADDYYEMQYYLATVLQQTGRFEEAEAEYLQLLKAGKSDYRERALWNLMQGRSERLKVAYGAVENRAPDAAEEKRVALPNGQERVVYQLSDLHKKFIETCDELVNATFTDPEYGPALEQNRAALAYLPGQILYNYGHFDEARTRFFTVIDRWPHEDQAAFSAALVLDSFTEDQDMASLRKYAGIFAGLILGNSAAGTAKTAVFPTLQEGAAFKLAGALIESGDRAGAAEAFLAFMKEFPRSEFVKDAHYNAANNFEIIGRVDEANRLFEEYVNKYPTDARSGPLFYRIASNYAGVLELDKAVRYFDSLVKNFPKYVDAPNALYNAGFLRTGMGDPAGAARNFETYAKDYPERPDAEEVMFQAGEQWESVSRDSALSFYKRYLDRYPDTNPDHVMEAYNRLANFAEETGNAKAIDRAWQDLADAYARLAGTGRIGPRGRHYAANAEFRNIERDLSAFKVYQYSKDDEKNAKLILEDKKDSLTTLEQRCVNLISTYQDYEYTAACLYVQGDAYYSYADMVYKYPCPFPLEEQCDIFVNELDKIRLPVEDKGKNRLQSNLDKAREDARWTEWHSKTMALLNERDPANYAQDRPELRAPTDSNIVPTAGALPVPAPEPGPAAPSTSPEVSP